MIKKPVTYENLDGEMVTKDFFFNLSKSELAEMALTSESGAGLADEIRIVQETSDIKTILKSFKSIISAAVGRRVGDRFIKDDETRSDLMDTEAYGELFMEIATDSKKAVDFIRGIIPASVLQTVDKKITDEGLLVEGWTPTERKVETLVGVLDESSPANVTVSTDLMGNIEATVEQPGEPKKNITMYTRKELMEMSQDEFFEVAGRDASQWSKGVLGIAMARRAGKPE